MAKVISPFSVLNETEESKRKRDLDFLEGHVKVIESIIARNSFTHEEKVKALHRINLILGDV